MGFLSNRVKQITEKKSPERWNEVGGKRCRKGKDKTRKRRRD